MTLSPLSAEELSQIRERAEMATQGPWRDAREIDLDRAADRRFVNHARSDIPRLLETVAYWQEEAEKRGVLLEDAAITMRNYYGHAISRSEVDRKLETYRGALSERAQGER